MPEVGVLNLTIQDNSTEAAGGLSELTGALVGLQNALGQGLKLSGVSKPLNTFANAVKENSKTFANVGSFLNAMSTYKKAFDEADKVRFNAQPIRDLKDAIGDGIRLGQAGTQIKNIREALTGEWNTDNAYKAGQALAAIGEGAKSIPSGLEKKADGISKVAAALQEYADASERIKSVVGSGPASALNDSMGKTSVGGRSFGLQFFGGKGENESAVNNVSDNIKNAVEGFERYTSTIHTAIDEARDFNIQIQDTANIVKDTNLDQYLVDPISSLRDRFQNAGSAAGNFRDVFDATLPKINATSAEATIASKNIEMLMDRLNTPIKYKEFNQLVNQIAGVKKEFLDAKRSAEVFEKMPLMSFGSQLSETKEVVEEVQQGAQAMQTMAHAANDYNQAVGKVYNYYKGLSLEDLYNGTREQAMGKHSLMSDWLHGNGTEFEQASAIDQAAKQLGMSNEEVKRQIDEWNGVTENMNTIDISKYIDMSQTDLLTMKMNGMQDALMRDIEAGKLDQQQIAERTMAIQSLISKIEELKAAQEDASGATISFGGVMGGLKDGIKKMFPTISQMTKRLGVIARYRFLRTVIKHITSGFSEGVQNVYQYSKAVGTSFAPAMDSAATAIQQMKNSIGAALAPALQALIPILNSVVNWFISGINVANQFFAILAGQKTWTRALAEPAEAFEKSKKAANGASKAVKDLLADWDELNIIQSTSNSGGSGSGKTAEEYKNMFEEVSKFDQKIKYFVEAINDQFGSVWNLAKKIGTAILGWKVANAFKGFIGTLGGLIGTVSTISLVFDVTTLLDKQYLKTGESGWLIGSVLTPLIGSFFVGKILSKILKGKYAKLALPLSLGVSVVADIITLVGDNDTSAISKESLALSAVTGLKSGAAAAYLAYTFAGNSLKTSLAGGAALAVTTFGAVVGIKTIVEAVNSGVTEDTIKGAAISSLAIGLGTGFMAKLAGASLVGSLGLGAVTAGLTVATITAAIGIGALLTTKNQSIKWGDYEATEKQIRDFIEEKGFTANINATLTVISHTVEILPEERQQLQADIEALVPTIQTIKYGLATEDTYTQLKNDLFGEDGASGIIGKINKYAEDNKQLIKTSFTLIPMTNGNGETNDSLSAEYMKSGITGWSEVEEEMGRLGTRLADALKGKTIDGIQTFDDELILELTEKITNVQKAITQAQASSEGVGGLMGSLSGLTQKNFDKATDIWDEYKKTLKEKYQLTLQEELTSYSQLAAFYRARGNEGDEEIAKSYDDKISNLIATWDDRLRSGVENMSEPGKEIFKKAIMSMLNFEISDQDLSGAFYGAGIDFKEDWPNFFRSMFSADGSMREDASEEFNALLDDILRSALGEDNYGTIKKLINNGAMSYADLIPRSVIDNIAEQFLAENGSTKMYSAWRTFMDNIWGFKDIYPDEEESWIDLDHPEIDITEYKVNMNDLVDATKQAVDAANMELNRLSLQKYLDTLNELNVTPTANPTRPPVTAPIPTPAPPTTGPFLNGTETVKTEPADPTQDAANVETGVRKGNSDLVGLMRDLIDVTRASNSRPINVTVSPSSGWGFHNVASGAAVAAVTGAEV